MRIPYIAFLITLTIILMSQWPLGSPGKLTERLPQWSGPTEPQQATSAVGKPVRVILISRQ